MATIDPSLVTEIAPHLTDETRIAVFLARAQRRHKESAWGDVYEDAMVLYAAHMMTRYPSTSAASEAGAGVPGNVSSRTAGDLAETYADTSSATANDPDADLKTTRYGLEYLALRASRSAVAPRTVRVY